MDEKKVCIGKKKACNDGNKIYIRKQTFKGGVLMAKGYKKSRNPNRLGDDDYMGFMDGIVKFINDSAGDPDSA